MCKTHSLDSTAHGDLLIEHVNLLLKQVDLLLKQVDLLSTAHFYTALQWTEMVKLDDHDTGGAMGAHTRSAKTTMEIDFTKTRQITSCT